MKYFSVFASNDEIAAFDAAITISYRADLERRAVLSPKYPRFPRNPMYRRKMESYGAVTYLDEETSNLLRDTFWENRLGTVVDVGVLAGCTLV